MIKSHIVFPGAFAAYIETAEKILEMQKSNQEALQIN